MKNNRKQNHDVLISGGGVPGLTLGVLLARAGANVAVVDPAPPSATLPASRTSALMTGSIAILQEAGVWDSCAGQGGEMAAMAITDDTQRTNNPVSVTFHAADAGQEIFGVNMPNHVVRDALLAEIRKHKSLTLHAPAKLISFETNDTGITAHLDGADDIRARLIVGADGRNSTTRSCAEIAVKEHDYKQTAITCLISHSRPHNNTSTEFHRSGGPFTLVPLPGNVCSVVWVEFTEDATAFTRLNRNAFEQALQDRTKGILGEVTLMTPPEAWPLKSLRAEKLTAPRCALMAEAAHVLHPLGAQGLNLSLRDAGALAAIIGDALSLGLDPGSGTVLARYESQRRQDVLIRTHGTDLLNRMVSTSSPLLTGLRRLGLRSVGGIGILKDFAMHHGMTG